MPRFLVSRQANPDDCVPQAIQPVQCWKPTGTHHLLMGAESCSNQLFHILHDRAANHVNWKCNPFACVSSPSRLNPVSISSREKVAIILFYTNRLHKELAAPAKFFITSSFPKRTILSPISLKTFSRLASSSCCKSWMSPSTSMTNPAL